MHGFQLRPVTCAACFDKDLYLSCLLPCPTMASDRCDTFRHGRQGGCVNTALPRAPCKLSQLSLRVSLLLRHAGASQRGARRIHTAILVEVHRLRVWAGTRVAGRTQAAQPQWHRRGDKAPACHTP